MANYPLSFDNFTNPTSVDSLNSPSHSLQHADANDAIEALEAKLGIGNSPAGSATAGRVLVAGTGGTTSWTTVSAGAISTTGGSAGQVLTAGTAGVAEWAYSGLTLIKSQTIGSAVSSVQVTDAFSADYDNYRIIVSGGTLGGDYMAIAFGSSTTGYYAGGSYSNYLNTTQTGFNTNNGSKMLSVGFFGTTNDSHNTIIDVIRPFTSNYTYLTWNFAGGSLSGRGGGVHAVAASYTSFTLSQNSGGNTTGGTIRVYGYRN